MRVYAHEAVFVYEEDALAVADVKKGGGGRVVGTADGVDAQFLKFLHAPLYEFVRHGGANSGVVLVQVYAFEDQLFAV